MTIGSLFSGIGGLELGLERAGLGPVLWQAEVDPARLALLERYWPRAKRYGDVRRVTKKAKRVELVCGGFPCTDISYAARGVLRTGLQGERSGLWFHFERVVSEVRPSWVVVENVDRWRTWLPVVRRGLWRLGYASVPLRVPASHVGAPHRRARVWLVAHADREGKSTRAVYEEVAKLLESPEAHRPWPAPPPRLGMAHGVPDRVDRLRACGNAVVPQVAEVIGRAIVLASA